MLLPPLDNRRRLAKPAKHSLPVLDGAVQVADGAHHALEGVGVARVAMGRRMSSDVGAGEEEDALAILALAQVESASALKVGSLEGRDEEA